MVTKVREVEVPKGYKPPAFYAKLGRVAGVLDTLTSEPRMYGMARRTKRRGRDELDILYGDVCRYIAHWEKVPDVHEHQEERIRRGRNFCSIIATVIMEV